MDIKKLLTVDGGEQEDLFGLANKVRKEEVGENIYFRGIIEFANFCEKDCVYCGIRKSNENVERFWMGEEEIIECLRFIHNAGYGSVVLQSGELQNDKFKNFLLDVVGYIQKIYPDMGVTVSCGEFEYDYYKKLREAGAHRYLLRIETSSRSLFKKLHPDGDFETRYKCLLGLKELGYQVGTGIMTGLPGQTDEDLVEDLKFFLENDFDMYGLGPYVVHEDTPLVTENVKLEWEKNRSEIFNKTLNFIALMRIILKDVNIAAGTALDVFDPLGRMKALKAGANVVMPSVTPRMYRDKYLLYQNKPCIDEDAEKCKDCMYNKVSAAGFKPMLGVRGDSLHFKS